MMENFDIAPILVQFMFLMRKFKSLVNFFGGKKLIKIQSEMLSKNSLSVENIGYLKKMREETENLTEVLTLLIERGISGDEFSAREREWIEKL